MLLSNYGRDQIGDGFEASQASILHHHQQQQQHQKSLLSDHASPLSGSSNLLVVENDRTLKPPDQMLRSGQERRLKPHSDQVLKCPRCESLNTKFCYYNNYSLTQPRHFCKNCKRYWTKGGALRNVPVGGGCRKNKRVKQRSSSSAQQQEQQQQQTTTTTTTTNTSGSDELAPTIRSDDASSGLQQQQQQQQHQHEYQGVASSSSSVVAAAAAAGLYGSVTNSETAGGLDTSGRMFGGISCSSPGSTHSGISINWACVGGGGSGGGDEGAVADEVGVQYDASILGLNRMPKLEKPCSSSSGIMDQVHLTPSSSIFDPSAPGICLNNNNNHHNNNNNNNNNNGLQLSGYPQAHRIEGGNLWRYPKLVSLLDDENEQEDLEEKLKLGNKVRIGDINVSTPPYLQWQPLPPPLGFYEATTATTTTTTSLTGAAGENGYWINNSWPSTDAFPSNYGVASHHLLHHHQQQQQQQLHRLV